MTNYITPTVTDRGSVVARTLGLGSHQTLESSGKRTTSLAGFGDTDPMAGKTYERAANGSVIVVNGTSSIVSETAGDAD